VVQIFFSSLSRIGRTLGAPGGFDASVIDCAFFSLARIVKVLPIGSFSGNLIVYSASISVWTRHAPRICFMRHLRYLLFLLGAVILASIGHTNRSVGDFAGGDSGTKFPEFDTVVKGAKEYDGLFKLFHKGDNLYAELRPTQLNTPFLLPVSIARGIGQGGHTLNDEQWVVLFKRVNDKIFLVRRNVRYKAGGGTPVARAVATTYTDSVLMSLRIQAIHPFRMGVLINLNDIFFTDFAQLRRGFFDASRSHWHKIKAFPNNIELQLAATYSGGGGSGVIDSRGTTIVIHYGICQLPDGGYSPRLADDRVGHFLSVVKDYSNDARETPFMRYVNRWRLERADGSSWRKGGKLVPPKKKIVFWIEKSVPDEYRAFVREGILEWNKAIEVRQQENEDFDPEDVNYNTFRWITNDEGYAMGPSRANPLTGELIDADIVFDASMVRYYRTSGSIYNNKGMLEDVSPVRAQQRSAGLAALQSIQEETGWDTRANKADPVSLARARAGMNGMCDCGPNLKRELHLLATAVMLRDDDDNKAAPAPGAGGVLPEEMLGQAIKEVVMHEVGHTLGLRHNFKASTMLKNSELHDTTITRSKGLVGSVMDYTPVNFAPKGVKQGDYFTTTIGPYDYWVIEYAYRPLSGGTEGELDELKKIASKCATPGLDYSTDEDVFTSSDPYVNRWDLGADPMKFSQDRILLAEELLGKLAEKGAAKGEGYQRVRQSFNILLNEYGNAAFFISKFIGGVSMHRDHEGDTNAREPFVVVSAEKQREALKFLQEKVLSDRTFQFSPKLLRRLGSDRWFHWGNYGSIMGNAEYPINERILQIQKVVLEHTLDGDTLARIQNNALKQEKTDKVAPLTVAEIFRSLTDGIWSDPINGAKGGKRVVEMSVLKRNLQREYLKNLSDLVLRGNNVPADARSLARLHLKDIEKRIAALVNSADMAIDDTTRAHLDEARERITKTLAASMQVRE
jgi:hypothetical protein